eukprot:1188258-Prorocentrum_minimum.AAC.1
MRGTLPRLRIRRMAWQNSQRMANWRWAGLLGPKGINVVQVPFVVGAIELFEEGFFSIFVLRADEHCVGGYDIYVFYYDGPFTSGLVRANAQNPYMYRCEINPSLFSFPFYVTYIQPSIQ